jgi:hypothetical protein
MCMDRMEQYGDIPPHGGAYWVAYAEVIHPSTALLKQEGKESGRAR